MIHSMKRYRRVFAPRKSLRMSVLIRQGQTEEARVRVALCRVENEHLVAGDRVHVHRPAAVGFSALRSSSLPAWPVPGKPMMKTRGFIGTAGRCSKAWSDLTHHHRSAQVADCHVWLDVRGFLALGCGHHAGGENEEVKVLSGQ